MRSWNDKLQGATETLLAAVTDLHGKSDNALMIRLLTSVSDVIQLVEQLNANHQRMEKELLQEKGKSDELVQRIDKLESALIQALAKTEKLESQDGEQHIRKAAVNSKGTVRDIPMFEVVTPQRPSTPASRKGDEKLSTPPSTPPKATVTVMHPSISPYKPPEPKALPPLPTLEDVEAEQRQRRSRKRAQASQKPLPCAKCHVRKRAMMLREHGHVKEDVFDRWSKRPGGCLAFMHYDEPVPKGVESQLSFPDTDTQSPEQ